jgi:hypothetical protein
LTTNVVPEYALRVLIRTADSADVAVVPAAQITIRKLLRHYYERSPCVSTYCAHRVNNKHTYIVWSKGKEERRKREKEWEQRKHSLRPTPTWWYCNISSVLLILTYYSTVSHSESPSPSTCGSWHRCRRQRRRQRHCTPCRGVGGFSEVTLRAAAKTTAN